MTEPRGAALRVGRRSIEICSQFQQVCTVDARASMLDDTGSVGFLLYTSDGRDKVSSRSGGVSTPAGPHLQPSAPGRWGSPAPRPHDKPRGGETSHLDQVEPEDLGCPGYRDLPILEGSANPSLFQGYPLNPERGDHVAPSARRPGSSTSLATVGTCWAEACRGGEGTRWTVPASAGEPRLDIGGSEYSGGVR